MRSVIDAKNCAICLFCVLTIPSRLLCCASSVLPWIGSKDMYSFPRHPLHHAWNVEIARLHDSSYQISKPYRRRGADLWHSRAKPQCHIQERSDRETDAVPIWCSSRMISAARSPTMTQGAIVLPVVTRGMIDPSAMRRFSTP